MEHTQALITHNVAAMRAEPVSGAEVVSQAILGDNVTVLQEREEFTLILTADQYEGWVWQHHVRTFDPTISPETQVWPFGNLPDRAYRVMDTDFLDLNREHGAPQSRITRLVAGTYVRKIEVSTDYGEEFLVAVPGEKSAFLYGYVASQGLQKVEADSGSAMHTETVTGFARRFIGTPYLWGGTTPFGFDCSGFVQRVYSLCNVLLPRDAYLQAQSPLGASLDDDEPLQAGDLVFFLGPRDPHQRGITHVGLMLDEDNLIHAYGRDGVIVTPWDSSLVQEYYTYRGAWRYVQKRNAQHSL